MKMIATRATVGVAPARSTRRTIAARASASTHRPIASSLRISGHQIFTVSGPSRHDVIARAAEETPSEGSSGESSEDAVDPEAEKLRDELRQAQTEEEGKERRTYNGVDTKGGRYGFGEGVDDALDATTNPDSFLFGGFLFVIGAVVLFVFGPRPPSELYY